MSSCIDKSELRRKLLTEAIAFSFGDAVIARVLHFVIYILGLGSFPGMFSTSPPVVFPLRNHSLVESRTHPGRRKK